MNLEHLNLDHHSVSIDNDLRIPVFLIAEDLKARKLINAFATIGCDGSFCTPDLCELVLAYAGFDDRQSELYDLYFRLLDFHCHSVSNENNKPIKEALEIFATLVAKGRGRIVNK